MAVRPNVPPNAPIEEQPAIGIIGMGAMGSLYARCFSQAGWKKSFLSTYSSTYPLTPCQDIHL